MKPPWEDVWLGLAVAQMRIAGETESRDATSTTATASIGRLPTSMADVQADSTLAAPITFVSFRDPMFIDAHGLFASESTISWHCRMVSIKPSNARSCGCCAVELCCCVRCYIALLLVCAGKLAAAAAATAFLVCSLCGSLLTNRHSSSLSRYSIIS